MNNTTENSCALTIRDCGLIGYQKALDLQKDIVAKRREDQIKDTVLMLEHPAVITLGARDSANILTKNKDEIIADGIEIFETRRGGGTTAHNPGQLVIYPIVNIHRRNLGINEYVRMLEAIGIEILQAFDVDASTRKGYPGLWVKSRKIASIGVRVSKGVTYHGMAINIANDLGIFDNMVPCGLNDVEMTSILKETGKQIPMEQVKKHTIDIIRDFLQK